MAELKVEIDPGEAGFDQERLERIDRHFARYVDDGRLPGWLLAVTRGGRVVHVSTYGQRDVEADRPVELDTVFRIYSMTKPVTSVAAMMLYEEGAFELKDPVSRFIPSFDDVRVYRSGSALKPQLEPAIEPVRMWHLLTHTSGLTYGFHHPHTLDALGRLALRPPDALSGGGGLVSTAADYHRFTQMLLGDGELEGTRLLGSRTVRYMTRNHLPDGADLEAFGRPLFAETTFDGVGFGLGFSVVDDPVKQKGLASAAEFAWGGAASTAFWVDPLEQITALFFTQL